MLTEIEDLDQYISKNKRWFNNILDTILNYAKKLENSEKWYSITLNSIGDAVIATDKSGKIKFMNPVAEKLTEWEEEDARGLPLERIFKIINEKTLKPVENPVIKVLKEGKIVGLANHTLLISKTGNRIPIADSGAPIRDINNTIMGVVLVFRDITKEKETEKKLRQYQKQFELILSKLKDPIFVISEEHKILYMNDNAIETFKKDYIGKKCYKIFHRRNKPCDKCLFEHMDDDKIQPRIEKIIKIPLFDEFRHFDVHISKIENFRGKPCIVESFRDITEIKRTEKKLKSYAERLERSNKELEQFAYVASHDLQEPLRSIGSFAQLLSRRYKDKLDADANDFIKFIVDGSNRMKMLINDLLTYSRIESRGKPFEMVSGEEIIKIVMSNLREKIDDNNVKITHDYLPNIFGDKSQLIRLFQNLIENAIKFRGEKPARIHISAEKEENYWKFAIKDNGIGIEKKHFDRIFIIFKRLHTKEEYPGSGLGLALCKKIIKRHNGRIWVDSELNKGSTFYFTIPIIK
ncbi:MAG: PAS domain S-box protein [Candidatus Lokiarchaeota archaeon]|nr:PAS domain S-box protein [Candidatus Lokiarchaeota archaeon]